jgi:hypothetical protein
MIDLEIDTLRIDLGDAAGQEYRVGPLVQRALALLAERWEERGSPKNPRDLGEVRVPDLRIALKLSS